MTYKTNAAIKHDDTRAKLVGDASMAIARCCTCEGPTEPMEINIVRFPTDDNGELGLHYNRVEILLRCFDCNTFHTMVVMPRDPSVPLEYHVADPFQPKAK